MLVSLDFFGSYLHWYVNRQKKLYTRLGGIFTIISFIINLLVLIFLLKDFFNRSNPQITENVDSNNAYKKIKFGNEKIYIPWTISDYQFQKVNFTGLIYPVIYYYYNIKDENNNEIPYNYKILNYTFCNETNIKSLKYKIYSNIDIDTFYCINTEDIIMGGYYNHDFYYYIHMDFFLCEDGVNMGTKGKKCTNYDELIKNIGINNAWHVEFYYPEVQFNPKNKDTPMEIFYSNHFYNFNKLNTKIERLYLKEFSLIDDQGWIFQNKKNYSLWGFDTLEYDSYTRCSDGEDFITEFSTSQIYSLTISLSNSTKIFNRKYTKLLDALGNIFSIMNIIFIIFKYFSQFFTGAYQDRNIINDIFVQKYFMNEKFNLYNNKINRANKLEDSVNFEDILNQPHNYEQNEELKNNYNNQVKTIEFKGSFVEKNYNNKKALIINNKKEQNLNCIKTKKPVASTQNLQYNFLPNTNNINSINFDNSHLKLPIKHYNSTLNFKKNYQLNHLKDYIKDEFINDDANEKNNQYESKDFKFPYYLYLLNFFNKTFGVTMCCINNKFRNTWKYMIDVFDVVKFIELQTNVDLINKILFELIIEENNLESNPINMIINNISKN